MGTRRSLGWKKPTSSNLFLVGLNTTKNGDLVPVSAFSAKIETLGIRFRIEGHFWQLSC